MSIAASLTSPLFLRVTFVVHDHDSKLCIFVTQVYRVVDFKSDKKKGEKVTQFESASLACIASYPGGVFNFIKKVAGSDPEPQFSDYEVTTEEGVS